MAIPFILVTGFLGSGKTTLLKRMLHAHAEQLRMAIVQNEFAQSGVDGAELRLTGKPFEILEINRGSVFCVCLLSDFVKSLSAMMDSVKPDVVVLEATGLADPIAVAQLLQSPELRDRLYLARAYCVVDASTFGRLEKAVSRVAHQVRVADVVVLNKVDLATAQQLGAAEGRVRELNPFATIERAAQCTIDTAGMCSEAAEAPVAIRRADEHAAFESCGRPPVKSVAVRSTRVCTSRALEEFVARHATGTYRLKGYVHTNDRGVLAVQSCFGQTRITPVLGYNGASELVAMGPSLDPEGIRDAFERMGA